MGTREMFPSSKFLMSLRRSVGLSSKSLFCIYSLQPDSAPRSTAPRVQMARSFLSGEHSTWHLTLCSGCTELGILSLSYNLQKSFCQMALMPGGCLHRHGQTLPPSCHASLFFFFFFRHPLVFLTIQRRGYLAMITFKSLMKVDLKIWKWAERGKKKL